MTPKRLDARAEIERLATFERRAPGTDAERRAALHLADRLRALGRDAQVQPVEVWPNWAAAHLLHALLAIVASVLSVPSPLAGTVIAFVALASVLGDMTGSFRLVRRLAGRRASQNVTSRRDGGKPGTIVLVAHYDAGRGGWLHRRPAERMAVLSRALRRPVGPAGPFFWSIATVFVCTGLRVLEVEGLALSVAQFVPTVLLILAVPLLVDLMLAPISPGANDNGSGVATALRLAAALDGELEHFDLWVVLPGAHEGMCEGMRRWTSAHRRSLDPERAIFVNLDEVGVGSVRYLRREGLLFPSSAHRTLIDLCARVAAEDDDGFGARPLVARVATDAQPVRDAGFPAITVCCRPALDRAPHHHLETDTPERVDDEALDRAFGFCRALIERLDETVGPRLAARG